jgi:hypothetical protein
MQNVLMKKLLSCLCIIVLLFSCKKEEESICVNAIVKWGGDPALDGSGWYLLADSTNHVSYFPGNLPDSFKVDGLPVNTCLRRTNEKFYCYCAQQPYKYQVISIKKL